MVFFAGEQDRMVEVHPATFLPLPPAFYRTIKQEN
jgi:hypothetical protein